MKALQIAQYIIERRIQQKDPISNLKLQGLLYWIQMQCLKELQIPCFTDTFYAWNFGPCIKDVYAEYCAYGSLPITTTYPSEQQEIIPEEIKNIINKVSDSFLQARFYVYTKELIKPYTPWGLCFKHPNGFFPNYFINAEPIPLHLIVAHAKQLNHKYERDIKCKTIL